MTLGNVRSLGARSLAVRGLCDPAHGNPATGSIFAQISALEDPMRTEVDLTKLTPYQREVLTALVQRLSKNDVETTILSAGVISEAMKQTVLDRVKSVIEELECEHTA